jgi:hypothetical protein
MLWSGRRFASLTRILSKHSVSFGLCPPGTPLAGILNGAHDFAKATQQNLAIHNY